MGLVLLTTITLLLWLAQVRWLVIFTLLPALVILWLFGAFHVKHLLTRHFFSLANVIESVRNGDFSMRVSPQQNRSAWSDVYQEVNLLAKQHQNKRLDDLEADILLDKLLAEFDMPVFIFDRNNVLQNCNKKGSELFLKAKSALIGMNTQQMQLQAVFDLPSGSVVDHWFPNRGGRWELRKNVFIQHGKRYSLVLINDLSRTLREEERNAWTRLIRVLGHELNNSLASLISVSQTLVSRLHDDKTEAWLTQYDEALNLIHERSSSLLRFTDAYTRLAKLPEPQKKDVDLLTTLQSLADFVDGQFHIENKHALVIQADPDQLQQLLINLMKNAVEASSTSTPVTLKWHQYQQGVRIQVIDQGLGLPNSDNLFVPFYTTKANGNGIGLFLCRQIAEAHQGTLRLLNRADSSGCIAECWLPLITARTASAEGELANNTQTNKL